MVFHIRLPAFAAYYTAIHTSMPEEEMKNKINLFDHYAMKEQTQILVAIACALYIQLEGDAIFILLRGT